MARVPDRERGDPLRPRPAGRSSSASARGSARGTRCSRARRDRIRRRSATFARGRGACCPTSRRWASTCSTCRRSIRSAAASARAEQHARRRARTTRAARGRSAPRRAGTRPSSQASARSTTSIASSRKPRALGLEIALDLAFQASPDHPYVKRASGLVPAAARRHDQVRGEPAEEIPGHLSVRLRVGRLAGALDAS